MKRVISLAVLLIYINMLIGCTKTVRLHRSDLLSGSYSRITAVVVANSGREIKFDENGGRYDDATKIIEGRTADGDYVSHLVSNLMHIDVEITDSDSSFVSRYYASDFLYINGKNIPEASYQKIMSVVLLNGDVVKFDSTGAQLSFDQSTVYGSGRDQTHIELPMDSVLYAQVIQGSPTRTAILLASLGAIVILGVIIAASGGSGGSSGSMGGDGDLMGSSCPLVHSFNGQEYILDAQPLSGAICPAMIRSEISALQHLQPVNDEYRLLIKNDLQETEYLDNISLFYVDYPEIHEVFFDLEGNLYHLGKIYNPVVASDEMGNDLSTFVRESDGISWRSRMPLDTLNPPAIDQHQLTFKFPKPPDAQTGILVFNAGTTFWASVMVKEFLQLKGSMLPEWYDALEENDQEMEKLQSLLRRDEAYLLQIEVKEKDGFQSQGYIHYGGPMVIEDRVVRLDLSHVAGDTITLRLNPPFGFWSIDYIGIAYEEYEQLKRQCVEFVSAYDHRGLDIRSALEIQDGYYHTMPNTGDFFNATFKSPRTDADRGMKRSHFIQMSGYYSLHLDLTAQPQTDRLEYFENIPGAALQLSQEEYMNRLAGAYKMH